MRFNAVGVIIDSMLDDKTEKRYPLAGVVLVGLLYLVALRLLSTWVWWLVVQGWPRGAQWMAMLTSVVPLPLLVALLPLVLAAIIIWLIHPGDEADSEPQAGMTAPSGSPGWGEATFSKGQIIHGLKVLTLIWTVLFVTQVLWWLSFIHYWFS